jgi:integrase
MEELFEYLKSYITTLPIKERQPCNKTKREYIREYTRMHLNGMTPDQQANRKSTYYKYRASWLYTNIALAENLIKEIESQINVNAKINLVNQLNSAVDRIKRYPPKDSAGLSTPFKKPPLQKSLSKKSQIITLKKNWSTLMFDHMRSVDSKYLDAVCIMYVSGCRPCELETGVQVINCKDGLKIIINGKKTHGGKYGQECREFIVEIDDPHYIYLKQIGDFFAKIDSAKLLGEQIRRNSKIILAHEKTLISPYTYRHNFSRMIKNMGLTRDEIALALGHCTDRSQKYYSHASDKTNSGFKISDIKGSKKIKKVVNDSYIKTTMQISPTM